MTDHRWTVFTISTDSEVPLVGELILIPYPMGLIDFPHGPVSSLVDSANPSHAYSTVSNTVPRKLRGIKSHYHHVLIVSVTHDKPKNKITLQFLPILSYSSPPSNIVRAGFSGTWSGQRWMDEQATDLARLHHLPIPATGWNPPASVPSAPIISFGGWLNTRPSWLILTVVSHDIGEGDTWCRHPSGPVMYDSEISALLLFMLTAVPRLAYEMAALANPNQVVNNVTLPSYDSVWAGVFGGNPFAYGGLGFMPVESTGWGPETDSEMAGTLDGDDGVDPISASGSPAEPPAYLAQAMAHMKRQRDMVIFNWNDGCRGTDDDVVEEESQISPLDVADVAFGETACPEP